MANEAWLNNALVEHIPIPGSDHGSIVLHIDPNKKYKTKFPFRLEVN